MRHERGSADGVVTLLDGKKLTDPIHTWNLPGDRRERVGRGRPGEHQAHRVPAMSAFGFSSGDARHDPYVTFCDGSVNAQVVVPVQGTTQVDLTLTPA